MKINSRKKLHLEKLEHRFALSSHSPFVFSTSQINTIEDAETTIPHLSIYDFDSKNLSLNLSTSGGQLKLDKTNGLFVSQFDNRMIVRGPKETINKALKSLKYQTIKDSNKSETIRIEVSDGTNKTIRQIRINIKPINDAPIISSRNVIVADKNFINWESPVFSDVDSKKIKVSLTSDNVPIQIIDPLAKNLNGKSEFQGDIDTINQLFSTYGKIKFFPKNNDDFQIKIQVSDGELKTNKTITITQKETVETNATNAVLTRLKDKNSNVAKPIFSTMNHQSGVYVRNVNGWAYDLDLTSISPWNSAGGNHLAGTLISPRHIVFATHYQIPVGAKIRFITKDNLVVERTLVNKISKPYTEMYLPDITVGVLDSDVPSSINFAKILPENWGQYIDNYKMNIYINPGNQIPCLALDQEEKALVKGVFNLGDGGRSHFEQIAKDPYKNFSEDIIPGDSGNPAFMIIDNQLVLITIWTFGGGGSGTFMTGQKNSINEMMSQLGGGYQLTEINLSKFAKIN